MFQRRGSPNWPDHPKELPTHIEVYRPSRGALFDGSGSFTDVIAKAVGNWPHAILAAEMDAGTRSVVSKVKGWSVEGSIWTKDKKMHTHFMPKMYGRSLIKTVSL